MKKIAIVVAVAKNRIIGAGGDMPWRLSTDLQRFKKLTMGKVIIMGRKTFQAIGNKPLSGRTNIVITRDKKWAAADTHVAHSLDAALELGQILADEATNEICIIGGGEIYRQSIDIVDTLHITWVKAEPKGDTFFPEVKISNWKLQTKQTIPAGEKDEVETEYCVYERRG